MQKLWAPKLWTNNSSSYHFYKIFTLNPNTPNNIYSSTLYLIWNHILNICSHSNILILICAYVYMKWFRHAPNFYDGEVLCIIFMPRYHKPKGLEFPFNDSTLVVFSSISFNLLNFTQLKYFSRNFISIYQYQVWDTIGISGSMQQIVNPFITNVIGDIRNDILYSALLI